MKTFTINFSQKYGELDILLESYCKRIGKLSSSNHDLDSLFSLLFEVSTLFREEKTCYKTMNAIINRRNEIEKNIKILEEGKQDVVPYINKLQKIFKGLKSTLHNERKPDIYLNSDEFYTKQIEQLKQKETEFDIALRKIDEYAQGTNDDDSSSERNKKLQNKIWLDYHRKQLEEEQLMAQRQSDAQNNLKKKIEESFNILTDNVNSISAEKERLESLFGIFKITMLGVVSFLLVWEIVCLVVWITNSWPHSLIEYMPFYLPIPLCGGLLWLSIFQMNRAQRQLLFLTNRLHHSRYIESLLLVINNISFNVFGWGRKNKNYCRKDN